MNDQIKMMQPDRIAVATRVLISMLSDIVSPNTPLSPYMYKDMYEKIYTFLSEWDEHRERTLKELQSQVLDLLIHDNRVIYLKDKDV